MLTQGNNYHKLTINELIHISTGQVGNDKQDIQNLI